MYFDTEMVQQIQNVNHSHIKICCYLQNLGFFQENIVDLKREFSLAPAQRRRAYKYLHKQLASYKNKNNGFAKSDAIQLISLVMVRVILVYSLYILLTGWGNEDKPNTSPLNKPYYDTNTALFTLHAYACY